MRNIRLCILLFSVIIISSCQNGANYYNNETVVSEDEATEVVDVSIKVPVNFDPKTPMSDELRNMNLHDMIVDKYKSFENPLNRRHPKPGYAYSKAYHFYDAAHFFDESGTRAAAKQEPEFKYVDESSNLAKVYFIDDFIGFVRYNTEYCDRIFQKIEDEEYDNLLKEIQEHQKEYE